MKLPDPDMFTFKEGIIGGDECILITPNDICCKWQEDTLQFRSVIIRKEDNKVISRGFNKFFNYSEHPEINVFPVGPFEVLEKMDGSLLIWGIHNGEIIHRTRGTFNAESMANGHEIKFLMEKYPLLVLGIKFNPHYSILTEWETKENIIVISRVKEPTLTLVGIVNNKNGQLVPQKELDNLAMAWGLERPTRYHYNSILECIEDVNMWDGREGVVIYSEDGQFLRKIKSDWYCELHKLATGIKGVNQVLGVFMTSPKFTESEKFYEYLELTLDHEIAEKCKIFIDDIVNAWVKYTEEVALVEHKLNNYVRPLETRKDQALAIKNLFGSGWWTILAFVRLDNKTVDEAFEMKVMKFLLAI